MKKNYLYIFMALLLFCISIYGCGEKVYEHGDPNANSFMPADSLELKINQSDENTKTVYAIGTELDPHFFSQNVGRKGGTGENTWEVKEEDWDNIFVPRMREMNLKRIRVMLLPSWYASTENKYTGKTYSWESSEMLSLYRVLDTAKELNILVNITMWGIDKAECSWLANTYSSQWCVEPSEDKEEEFVNVFADCIKYLIETKGFNNINEVTLFNEPNAIYNVNYGMVNGNKYYVALCKKMDTAFKNLNIRHKVLFNLSDDARDSVWLGKTLSELDGIIDVANSHTYDFGDTYNAQTGEVVNDMSNKDICENILSYNLKAYSDVFNEYDIPHIWGEFGTKNTGGSHIATDNLSPSRGIDIPRIMLNMFNMGSSDASYWVLFSQYYYRSDANISNM